MLGKAHVEQLLVETKLFECCKWHHWKLLLAYNLPQRYSRPSAGDPQANGNKTEEASKKGVEAK